MRTHVINVRLRIEATDRISRADLLADLRKQLGVIQEQAPYRDNSGASWWTNRPSAVLIGYAEVGEQLLAEREEAAQATDA